MPSIEYDAIYSRFYSKASAYDLLDMIMREDEQMVSNLMCSWLHEAVYYPYIRKLFKTISADDLSKTVSYEMNYEIDEDSDMEFLINLLSYGMIYYWIEPKVNSLLNISQFYGTSEEKYYSQANHLAEIRNLRDDIERKIRSLIRDRGYSNNKYLDGESASATIRR